MTLIEILFNRVRKIEPETHWEVEGCAFTFPIANRRTGRVWAVVRQEATQIFIEASLIERSELGVLADCVSTELLREMALLMKSSCTRLCHYLKTLSFLPSKPSSTIALTIKAHRLTSLASTRATL
jgi:hypothetical protein